MKEENQRLSLNEILTKKQMDMVTAILDLHRDETAQRIKALKRYCNDIKDDLEKKEIHPDYLAYMIDFLHVESTAMVKAIEEYQNILN